PAARALGDLARERWSRATGKAPDAPPPPADDDRLEDLWPDSVTPLARGVPVGISRTAGAFGAFAQVSEIEAMTLAMIAGAKRTIFVENQ
ncbi:hypothetical protein NL361_27440, partial [Klebsiella pneumoniae]|nr:hypothetical protein [Klebsiella pneumoniae]